MRLTLLFSFLIPSLALAQAVDSSSFHFDQLADARGFAMGGAYRVLGISADATDANPASLLALKTYQIELTGGWDFSRHNGLGGLVFRDSQEESVAAGLGYHYLSLKDAAGNAHAAHESTLAIAFPIADAVSLGLSGKYVHQSELPHINAATMDVGIDVQPMKGLFVGIAGHNVIDTNHPELARFYSAGIGYTQGLFDAEFDVTGDPWRDGGFKPTYSVGAEAVAGQTVPLRAGFQSDTLTGEKFISAGIGFFSEGGSIDFGYRHRTDAKGEVLVVSLKIQM
jgi:hypothetical protein